MNGGKRYWIAINGASCALSSMPFREPVTVPVAQQYVGFPTLAEAQKAQSICLHGTQAEQKAFMRGFYPDIKAGRIRVIQPVAPQPPTHAPTMWMESEIAPVIVPVVTGGNVQN
jgi:hypothetical protein